MGRSVGGVEQMRFLLAAMAFALGAAQAAAQTQQPVDLELVLAVDVSWSMDIDEQQIQRQGYVDAFRHPEVIQAIQTGLYGRIAVTYVEWAGDILQQTVVPWTVIDSPESSTGFASALTVETPARFRRTSISEALIYSGSLFDNNGYEGTRRLVDISGDGPNNQGRPVELARDELVNNGITINGLPVMIKRNNPGGFQQLDALDIYYEDCVIGGAAAFVIPVQDPRRFGEAIRRKLVLEIASPAGEPKVEPAQFVQRQPRIDCLIGEKMWRRTQDNYYDNR